MKISIRKSNLLQGINIVSKAVSNKTTHPILSCILVEAAGGVIKLTANDMEIGIESYVDGTVIEDGKVALEAKLFSDFIRKLPDSDITIESDKDSKTLIKCERLEFNIPGKSGEDFSNLPVVSKDKFITISQFALREVINQTIFSISDNENNKLMTGELFEVSNNKLSVVSLDGHRISIRYIDRTFGTGSCSCLRSPEAVHIYRFVIIRIVELNICKAPLLILTRAIVCGHRRDTAYRQNKNKRQQKCQSPEMLHSHSPFYDILRLQVSNSPVVLCHRL